MLDMGEPVKIADLARNMITLSGMSVLDEQNPAGDIEIRYVGLRPGEKLYEELFVGDEALETTHPRIRMAKDRSVPLDELERHLDKLEDALKSGNPAAVRAELSSLISPDGGELTDGPATPARVAGGDGKVVRIK